MDDFLVTENFGMILGQPVHTDDNVENTKFNRHEINFKRLVQRGLQAHVRVVQTDKGTDGENLDKLKEKGDECIFVGYSNHSRAYRVFNKRTRVIMESIHVNFDELPQMASDQNSSDPAPECQTMALEHDSLSPTIQCQANVSQAD
nr:Gag-Pol polyprotein [Tanacetum cinerariifolium]